MATDQSPAQSRRLPEDEQDLQAVREHVWKLERDLNTARTYLTLHEAARSAGIRPPGHVRGLRRSLRS